MKLIYIFLLSVSFLNAEIISFFNTSIPILKKEESITINPTEYIKEGAMFNICMIDFSKKPVFLFCQKKDSIYAYVGELKTEKRKNELLLLETLIEIKPINILK
jgi:hypothetical protein